MRHTAHRLATLVPLLVALALIPSRVHAQNCNDPDVLVHGMNIDPWNPAGDPSAADLQTAGVRWVRIEFKEGPSYAFFDPKISALRAAGIKVLLLVDYASFSNGGLGSPGMNGSDADWTTYNTAFVAEVGNIAAHYGNNVDAWQVWNEQDLFQGCGPGYDPCVPAHKYAEMLRDSYTAIRAQSTATIVSGSMASGNPGYITDMIAAVGAVHADIIAVHPYGQRAPDDWPNTSWGFGNMSTLFDNYLAFGKNLWVTEIGTVDTANQAQYLTNVYDLVKTSYSSTVPVVFWFCWSDGMVSPHGILDSGGSPKASYTSYQTEAPAWDPLCGGTTPVDGDGDGHSPPSDCDDGNASIHPGAAEVCGNGIDEDCVGGDASCGGNEVTFSYVPAAPHALQLVEITVSGAQGYTNIDLAISGPTGGLSPTLTGIDGSCTSGPQPCRWSYEQVFPQEGSYNLAFRADPSTTTYGTDVLVVTAAPVTDADAGVTPDARPTPDGAVVDAGPTLDGAVVDAEVTPDASGGGGIEPGATGGCACTSGRRPSMPLFVLLGFAWIYGWRRRRALGPLESRGE